MERLTIVTARPAGIDKAPIGGARPRTGDDSDTSRRECLKSALAAAVATALMLGAPPSARWAAAQSATPIDAAHRNKLILLLRKRGMRGGLDAKIGAILGLYNRGQNILVARVSMRKGIAILTFGRIVMRNRELYYWGFQPDARVLSTYFFLTNLEFKLVARGAELMDDKAASLPQDRGAAMFAQIIKDWITILDALSHRNDPTALD